MRLRPGEERAVREMLDQLSAPSVFALTLVLLAVVSEIGFRIAGKEADDARKTQSVALLGSMLGLLALLLGFTFSIAQARQLDRTLLLVDEANAIGTTYLRAAMLPPPHGAKVRQLLRDYVDLRLGIRWREGFARKLERSEALHAALWKEAVACAAELPASLPVSLFITSLNDVIDLHTERVSAAVYRRLPNAIVATMFAVALLAMFIQGHSAGLSHGRATLATLAVTVSVAAVLTLIMDLDRPRQSMFRVDQSALVDLQKSMKAAP